jgi:DNA-binding MarR family transcriptional regulator
MRSKNQAKRLRGGELEILKALAKKPQHSGFPFKDLLEKAQLSKPVLSDYLKNLQKKGYVVRDIDSRNYDLTLEGRAQLNKVDSVEKIEFLSVPFTKNVTVDFPSPSAPFGVPSWPVAFTDREVTVAGYLYIDQFSQAEATSIVRKLEETKAFALIHDLFNNIGTAVAEKKGLNCSLDSLLRDSSEPQYQKLVKCDRARLDYYAAVLLIFDGTEISKKINWEKMLKRVHTEEAAVLEKKANFETSIKNDVAYRRSWLENIVLNQIPFLRLYHARSEGDLERELVRMVVKQVGSLLGESAESEVRVVFAELKKTGVCKIVPEYLVEVNKEPSSLAEKTQMSKY